jgi:hypothetical protein
VKVCRYRLTWDRKRFLWFRQSTNAHRRADSLARGFLSSLIVALVTFFITAGSTYSQTGRATYSIEGKLIDPSESAVPKARVVLRGVAGAAKLFLIAAGPCSRPICGRSGARVGRSRLGFDRPPLVPRRGTAEGGQQMMSVPGYLPPYVLTGTLTIVITRFPCVCHWKP